MIYQGNMRFMVILSGENSEKRWIYHDLLGKMMDFAGETGGFTVISLGELDENGGFNHDKCRSSQGKTMDFDSLLYLCWRVCKLILMVVV